MNDRGLKKAVHKSLFAALSILLAFILAGCSGGKAGKETAVEERLVFFGDSITYMGGWRSLLPGKQTVNLGVSGDRVEDLVDRLDEVIAARPTRLFIMAGVNDLLSGGTVEDTILDYERLLTGCEACGCAIYVQSVLPVADGLWIDAELIESFNALLRGLAEKHGAQFIDLFPIYADSEGYLLDEYTIDGLHLTNEAYRPWAEEIERIIDG